MEVIRRKGQRDNLIVKTWKRCRSIGSGKNKVGVEGCFSVYVGAEKQRFVIKTEHANHPLFKMLLDEAESEYGYTSKGPLWLPCKVELFYKVLVDMDIDGDDGDNNGGGCGFPRSPSSYRLLSMNYV